MKIMNVPPEMKNRRPSQFADAELGRRVFEIKSRYGSVAEYLKTIPKPAAKPRFSASQPLGGRSLKGVC